MVNELIRFDFCCFWEFEGKIFVKDQIEQNIIKLSKRKCQKNRKRKRERGEKTIEVIMEMQQFYVSFTLTFAYWYIQLSSNEPSLFFFWSADHSSCFFRCMVHSAAAQTEKNIS